MKALTVWVLCGSLSLGVGIAPAQDERPALQPGGEVDDVVAPRMPGGQLSEEQLKRLQMLEGQIMEEVTRQEQAVEGFLGDSAPPGDDVGGQPPPAEVELSEAEKFFRALREGREQTGSEDVERQDVAPVPVAPGVPAGRAVLPEGAVIDGEGRVLPAPEDVEAALARVPKTPGVVVGERHFPVVLRLPTAKDQQRVPRGLMAYREPLVVRQIVPSQVVNGIYIPRHAEYVTLKPGQWVLSGESVQDGLGDVRVVYVPAKGVAEDDLRPGFWKRLLGSRRGRER